MTKMASKHIRGGDAARMAVESAKRGPVTIEPPPADDADMPATTTVAPPLAPADTGSSISQPTEGRKKPPRVRKPSPQNDKCFAPTADVEGHRAALREAFGNTLSDEFVSFLLGKLDAVLRPGPFDQLDEATLNAAIALISSEKPETELQALLLVEIVGAGCAGLKFLRQSQVHMDDIYIDVYGGFAIKLLRLQSRRSKPLIGSGVESGKRLKSGTSKYILAARGWSKSSTPAKRVRGMAKNDTRPHASGGYCPTVGKSGQSPPMWSKNSSRPPLPPGSCQGPQPVSNARRG